MAGARSSDQGAAGAVDAGGPASSGSTMSFDRCADRSARGAVGRVAVSDLSWRYTWPDEGPDFVLERAREGEPETIGRVMAGQRSSDADALKGWTWTLTSQARPVGIRHPGYLASGFEETKREARDALVAAWRREEAFRTEAIASEAFAGLAPYMRDFLVNGQPVPPGRVAGPQMADPASRDPAM